MADPIGAVDDRPALHGPGLSGLTHANGQSVTVGPRPAADGERLRGSVPIGWAAWLLTVAGAGALYVSFAAQRQYVFAARHQDLASIIEALLLDAMMIVFTLLALGLSMARKSSRTERALILACAVASAGMNVSAADVASPRSVAAYAVPPIALAIVVDRVVAVIRRHVLADEEVSAWTTLASFVAGAARTTAIVLLYSLRFALAPASTASGVRRWILNLTPLPEAGPRPGVTHSADPAPALASAAGAADPAGPAEPTAAETVLNGDAGPGIPATHGSDLPALPPAGVPLPADPRAAAAAEAEAEVAAEPVTDEAIAAFYAADLEAGRVPSGKAIRRQFNVGSGRADRIVDRLTAALAAQGAE